MQGSAFKKIPHDEGAQDIFLKDAHSKRGLGLAPFKQGGHPCSYAA